jgi:carboxyl-terminal processing protease
MQHRLPPEPFLSGAPVPLIGGAPAPPSPSHPPKPRRGLRTILLALAAFAGGAAASELAHATSEKQNPYHLMEQLGRVLVAIEDDYVDPVDRARLIEGGIKGMVAELDPHSSYLPPEDYAIFQGDLEGRFGGIGVEVDFEGDFVTVIAPIEGSPAHQAGVKPGDRIVAIDNMAVRGQSPADLVRSMRGDPGTKVILSIRRDGVERLMTFVLVRRTISVASVSSKLLTGDIGYLRIKTFQTGTHAELLEHVGRLRKARGKLDGIVLDLRNNPGGSVDEADAVADEFLSGGVIFTTRRRGRVVDEARADAAGALRRQPTVVLVNEFSASASELVAGALRDNQRAQIVGAPTFGKGSVQMIVDLPGGAGLRLTTLRYYTPSGRAIQAEGIQPDIVVGAAPSDFGIVREKNLENHLPASEGALHGAVPPVTEGPSGDAGPKTTEDVDHGVAREIPEDPTNGPDEALKVAYRVLKEAVQKR